MNDRTRKLITLACSGRTCSSRNNINSNYRVSDLSTENVAWLSYVNPVQVEDNVTEYENHGRIEDWVTQQQNFTSRTVLGNLDPNQLSVTADNPVNLPSNPDVVRQITEFATQQQNSTRTVPGNLDPNQLSVIADKSADIPSNHDELGQVTEFDITSRIRRSSRRTNKKAKKK